MITVHLNETGYSYDVHSLVKAFYPREDVKVNPEQMAEHRKKEKPETAWMDLTVTILPGRIEIQERSAVTEAGSMPEPERGAAEATMSCLEFSPDADRATVKNHLKALLYRVLRRQTGRDLPWGNLTGIRPVKIPMAFLKEGRSPEEISRHMQERYFVSSQKAALALDIAQRERRILEQIYYQDGYSLYVGIPFCPSICLYCSFSSSPVAIWKDRVDDYLDALCKEIDATAELFAGKKLCSVYMGGGTPTTLEPAQMDRLLTKLEERFDLANALEITVEAGRPDSITREKLAVLRTHGIDRISVNPQTMNQRTLDVIGRHHTVEQVEASFYLARELGFENINMDLIVGLPGEGKREIAYTMEQLRRLDPDSVTVHSLALKRGTRLHLMKEEYVEDAFQSSEEIMNLTAESCAQRGLHPYYLYRQKNMAGNFENTGYAREGKEGLYNILIMEEVQSILALGAGASTKLVLSPDHIERIENVKDIRQYLERIDEMIQRKQQIPKMLEAE